MVPGICKRIMNTLRRISYVTLGLIGLAAMGIMLAISFGGDEVYCRYTDIDVNSGRIRVTRYFLGVAMGDEVKCTEFSKIAERLLPRKRIEPDWRRALCRVLPIPPLRGSSYLHYEYGTAITECNQLVKLFMIDNLDDLEKKSYIEKYLKFMKLGDIESLKNAYRRSSVGDQGP